MILGVVLLVQCQGVTDGRTEGRTDRQTDTSTMAKTREALHAVAHKNRATLSNRSLFQNVLMNLIFHSQHMQFRCTVFRYTEERQSPGAAACRRNDDTIIIRHSGHVRRLANKPDLLTLFTASGRLRQWTLIDLVDSLRRFDERRAAWKMTPTTRINIVK